MRYGRREAENEGEREKERETKKTGQSVICNSPEAERASDQRVYLHKSILLIYRADNAAAAARLLLKGGKHAHKQCNVSTHISIAIRLQREISLCGLYIQRQEKNITFNYQDRSIKPCQ